MSNLTIDSERISVGPSHPLNITVSVDTLRASTLKAVSRTVISRLQLRSKRVRPFGWRLNCFDSDHSIYFYQRKDDTVVFELSLSSFPTVWEAFDHLRTELGPWALEAKIARCEVNLNFPLPIEKVFHGLDFGKKRTCERWGSHAGGESFYIGVKGNRLEMIIYDKRSESRAEKNKGKPPIKHPCTRIEIQTLPKKDMKVRELSLLLNHCPFKHVTRYKVNLIKPEVDFDENVHDYLRKLGRFHEFKSKVDDWGFYLARRKIAIQTQRNFHVHYGEFYSRQKLEPSLDEIFQIGIRGFFPQ